MDGMSLLDVLRGVMLDPAEQAAYNANPGAYLGQYGYDDVDPADLSEAFGLVADTLPPEVAQTAWQASADHGDAAFGGVTTEFDTQSGVDATVAPDPSPNGAGEPGEAEPALSFGYGESDFSETGGDPAASDEAAADTTVDLDVEGTFGDEAAAGELDGDVGDPGLDDADDLGDDGLGGDDLDDDGLGGDPLSDVDDLDGGGLGLDDLDGVGGDTGEIDALDDLGGVDDADIGSF
jgi:hypothetical protein